MFKHSSCSSLLKHNVGFLLELNLYIDIYTHSKTLKVTQTLGGMFYNLYIYINLYILIYEAVSLPTRCVTWPLQHLQALRPDTKQRVKRPLVLLHGRFSLRWRRMSIWSQEGLGRRSCMSRTTWNPLQTLTNKHTFLWGILTKSIMFPSQRAA